MATIEDFLENPFPPGQKVRLSVFGVVDAANLEAKNEKAILLYRPRQYVRDLWYMHDILNIMVAR